MEFLTHLRLLFALLTATTLLLGACGGGSTSPIGDTPDPADTGDSADAGDTGGAACDPSDADSFDQCGVGYVTVTDADGDILSYTVDLVSLSLRRANGSEVETLPASTRIDFADYTELSEFVTAARIPPGTYVEGTVTVDFTDAQIYVERDGEAVAAEAVNTDGSPLGRYSLNIQLTERGRLVVTAGRPALLAVDFDLAASNEVDVNVEPPRVTVQPVLLAEIDPLDEKTLRLRGALEDVALAEDSYAVSLLPLSRRSGAFGDVEVSVDESTTYDIDGRQFTGREGLEALAALPQDTLTLAFGRLARGDLRYTAETVLAGTSVPGIEDDTVTGTVVARQGNDIVIRGAAVKRSEMDERSAFVDRVTATLGQGTTVTRPGDPLEGLSIDAVSVGQRVRVLGEITDTPGGNDADAVRIDAANGAVALLRSRLSGIVADREAGLVTLDLAEINGRPVTAYDFAGTGAGGEFDADPSRYAIDTGPLATDAPVGAAARVYGYVTPFGEAPPDFTAVTTVEYETLRALVRLYFGEEGATDALLSADAGGIALNVDALERGVVRLPGLRTPVAAPLTLPVLAAADGRNRFALAEAGEVTMYQEFDAFVEDLTLALDGTTGVLSVTAAGAWTPLDTTLEARTIVISLTNDVD